MNDRLFTFIKAIQRNTSMTKAAQSVFVSQPYFSRVIKQAEFKYGVQLVDRNQHPVQLTEAGDQLLRYLKESRHIENRLNREIQSISHAKAPVIRLGITPPMAGTWFSATLPEFCHQFPDLQIKVFEVGMTEAEELLNNYQLDCFIGRTVYLPHVESLPLTRVKLSLVIPNTAKGYQADQFFRPYTNAVITNMDNEPFIFTTPKHRFFQTEHQFFAAKGVHVMSKIEIENAFCALDLVQAGLGSTIVDTNMLTPLQACAPEINAFQIPTAQLSIDVSISVIHNSALDQPLAFLVQQARTRFTAPNSIYTDTITN